MDNTPSKISNHANSRYRASRGDHSGEAQGGFIPYALRNRREFQNREKIVVNGEFRYRYFSKKCKPQAKVNDDLVRRALKALENEGVYANLG